MAKISNEGLLPGTRVTYGCRPACAHGEFMGFGVRSKVRTRQSGREASLLPSPHARLSLLPPSILVSGRQNGKKAVARISRSHAP